MTVNEGATTDTAMDTDFEGEELRHATQDNKDAAVEDQQGIQSDPEDDEALGQGILSSDEEESAA